ncbi:hypothetical protein OROHE_005714 [Orobanche hederae]
MFGDETINLRIGPSKHELVTPAETTRRIGQLENLPLDQDEIEPRKFIN